MADQVDCVVIGAGVVGLAVARALALSPQFAGKDVMVLEAENAIGTATSSRNSEVIHAGIYYPAGSLKAQLCVRGKAMLYDYCELRGIGYQRCGKLIVATNESQIPHLHDLMQKATANGVKDLVLLDREEAIALEPQLNCVAALFSPSTGIVDSHALMLALQGDFENAGGMVVLNTAVSKMKYTHDAIQIVANDGAILETNAVINAAGLYAPQLAISIEGLAAEHIPTAYFCKGNYFALAGKSPFSHLIYPVPEAAGLGVHLTLDLGGQAKFGPDTQWVDCADDLVVDPNRGDVFYEQIRKYWPALHGDALIPGYAGIRPKISAQHEAGKDFVIQAEQTHGLRGLVNLFGIESPGLTSALAIAEYVSKMWLVR